MHSNYIFFSYPLIKIKISTQLVLYINYFSWFSQITNFFLTTAFILIGRQHYCLINVPITIVDDKTIHLCLNVFCYRHFSIENLLCGSSIIVPSGITRFWISVLKYDWTADNYSDGHYFLQLFFDHSPLHALENRCNYELRILT